MGGGSIEASTGFPASSSSLRTRPSRWWTVGTHRAHCCHSRIWDLVPSLGTEFKCASGPPIGEVRWARGSDSLDWRELDDWTSRVEDAGRFAEVLVVDDEFEVTSYRFHHVDPTGTHLRPRDLGHEDLTHIRRLAEMEAQAGYLPDGGIEWPLPQMGVRNAGGTILSKLEWEALKDAPDEPEQDDAALLWALLDRGLLVRPGFKFGCEWRAYDLDMDATHAPWLIQPNWRSPVIWEGVCLAARLVSRCQQDYGSRRSESTDGDS